MAASPWRHSCVTFGSRLRYACIILSLVITHPSYTQGLHGYIASHTTEAPTAYTEGYGFYSAIWTLTPEPIAGFQIGLPSTWIIPDNSDNTTIPLCPVGTLARDNWPERGPTYSSVFQTVEGGPGYWVGNKFHYGPPKFKMNSTPDCYNNQISTPGWQFFFSDDPLPDDVLGIAQISNRLLIPPDGLPFQGEPNGAFLGISYLVLPLTSAYDNGYPVGEKNWTLFLNATNFKGPLACYLPETWAKISADYPFDHGRGLDARSSKRSLAGGSMEINTVPVISETDANGDSYFKIPLLQFPVNDDNRTVLAKDVSFYSKNAIYHAVLEWKNGGDAPSGLFNRRGIYEPAIYTWPVTYRQQGKEIKGINEIAEPTVFTGKEFGLQWSASLDNERGYFPQYFKDSADLRVAIDPEELPESTNLIYRNFNKPYDHPAPYHTELTGAWRTPGPVSGPHYAHLTDGSTAIYFWYRFIDQPVFQQFDWSAEKKDSLQQLIEAMHENWPIDQDYMRPLSSGELVSFDQALFVTPPTGLEIGYVPIVIRQEKNTSSSFEPLQQDHEPFLSMYPNPANEILHIKILVDPGRTPEIVIINLQGRVVKTQTIKALDNAIYIGDLQNGIYIISYSDGQSLIKRKFFKTN